MKALKSKIYTPASHQGPPLDQKKDLESLISEGRFNEAEQKSQSILSDFPDDLFTLKVLGVTQGQLGRLHEAKNTFLKATRINPSDSEPLKNLGIIALSLGKPAESKAFFKNAISLNPNDVDSLYSLAGVLKDLGELKEAEKIGELAVRLSPNNAACANNLGVIKEAQGKIIEAENLYQSAVHLAPCNASAYSNLLFLQSSNHKEVETYLENAKAYGHAMAQKVSSKFPHQRRMPRGGRLRIGFVSADFRKHPVGYFLRALIENVARLNLDFFAYSNTTKEDELTSFFKEGFHSWSSIVGKSDSEAAQMINTHQVDILIDLGGHTKNNRLPLFSWKAAPVQLSWLGYHATTGVKEIDYILGDEFVTPYQEASHFVEKIWQLPKTSICFSPPDCDIEVQCLPALSTRQVTFGCFNNLNRLTDNAVEVFASILKSVTSSRLLLKSHILDDPQRREGILQKFEKFQISCGRIELQGRSPRDEYLNCFNNVDIALTTFPYAGSTTAIEGLWMGVPSLFRKGDRLLSHIPEIVAYNSGLVEWIAEDDDAYIQKAVQFASNLPQLNALRLELRSKIMASALFDSRSFAEGFQESLRSIWRETIGY